MYRAGSDWEIFSKNLSLNFDALEPRFRKKSLHPRSHLQAILGTKNASKRGENEISQSDVLGGVFARENATRSCVNT